MRFINRMQWGGRGPTSTARLQPSAINTVVLHYTTGNELGNRDSAQWVRNIQNHHMSTLGWADVGYNFIVSRRGDIYVCRGWDVLGAQARGINSRSIGIAFLGGNISGTQNVTPDAREAINYLLDEAEDRYPIKQVIGHQEAPGAATACPGQELMDFIAQGFPLLKPGVETPEPEPEPTETGGDTGGETGVEDMRLLRVESPMLNGGDVASVQALLVHRYGQDLGRYGENRDGVDGWYGQATADGVRAFQRAASIGVDGVVGPQTRRALLGG